MQTSDFLAGVLKDTNYEPQRSNQALLRFNQDLDTKIGQSGASEILKLALASFPLPKNETQPSMLPYINEVRKFAGATVFDDMTVVFHDYVSRDVSSVLWAWRYKIHDPRTGVRGLKSQYAVDGEIEAFAPDGSRSLIYKVQGAWPGSIDGGEIEMGNDEPVRIAIRFICDKIYPEAQSGLTLPAPHEAG